MSNQSILAIAAVKGATMATIIFAIAEPTFIQGILTAVASACVSGVFLLVSVRMTTKKTTEKIDEAKDKVVDAVKENAE